MILITHCADTLALLAEAKSIDPSRVEDDANGNPVALVVDAFMGKTPTHRNGTETLALIQVEEPLLSIIRGMTSVTILAEAPNGSSPAEIEAALDADPVKATTFDQARGSLTVQVDDGNGGFVTETQPRMMWGFA